MSTAEIWLTVSVFLACAVEAVEALTIVLAIGATRGWRWALSGAAAALIVLSAIVAVAGPALTSLPLDLLSAVVGGVLLVFGLYWLRKAVLRAAGRKALHDEGEIYAEQITAARAAAPATPDGVDHYAFAVCFQGVFVEGLEIVVIVLSFSASKGHLALAAAAAAVAVAIVAFVGAAARAPLTRVPENTMKLLVGAMLTSFGVFWGARGLGLHWPGGDIALPLIVVAVLAAAAVSARLLRTGARSSSAAKRTSVAQAEKA
ncbi:MAG TPA: hypothetical protein VIC05_04520 [Solirubrobacteraceae bacterium]